MKFICVSIIIVLISVCALGNDNKGQSFIISPDGELQQQSIQFITLEFQQKTINGLILFLGTCRWNSDVDQNRSFAVVPVKLFRQLEKQKKLIPVAIYYTAADGKFYFITPDDGGDYALGPSVSQAQNLPDKVKQFFRELEEKGLKQKEMIH